MRRGDVNQAAESRHVPPGTAYLIDQPFPEPLDRDLPPAYIATCQALGLDPLRGRDTLRASLRLGGLETEFAQRLINDMRLGLQVLDPTALVRLTHIS